MTQETQTAKKRAGNLIHVLTASGAVAGLAALQSIINGDVRSGLVWLIVCQVLDGIDGPIARSYGLDQTPGLIDGHILDLVVDYVTCAVVPAALLVHTHLVRPSLSMLVAGAILLTSALWFARTDQETPDAWFNGFPAGWNIVIPSLLLLHAGEARVLQVVTFFCVLQMTKVQFPHIMKARAMRRLTLAFTVLYFGCFVLLSADYPGGPGWARTVLLVTPLYLAFLVIWRTWAPDRLILGRAVRERPLS